MPSKRKSIAKTKPTPKKARGRVRSRRLKAAEPALLYERLQTLYPDAHCELDFTTPFQLLVATILSAQCTDKRVNMVTPVLFKRYPSVESLARAKQEDVEEIIKSTGFFRNKAKAIIAMAGAVADTHRGDVPSTLEALVTLPGVGRKTANVILGNAYGVPGITVDTHLSRLSKRMGLTKQSDPVKIERDLMEIIPEKDWTMFSHRMIFHGRQVCFARKPNCEGCLLAKDCPKVGVAGPTGGEELTASPSGGAGRRKPVLRTQPSKKQRPRNV